MWWGDEKQFRINRELGVLGIQNSGEWGSLKK